nr:immunoglobulin light chain junction region [Macaca mulatta]MOY07683.1 immunoglobulin light chain junction region [Macaca mulatta]MOY07991.1 immunoglobulin light chain junction region [Macaca mulatta]MOY08500.1 immunoglobulin light chain junction region [Macaca mulatta]MOY17430.1 immunoglobulin light chain junction region [Macaca mulatta]
DYYCSSYVGSNTWVF